MTSTRIFATPPGSRSRRRTSGHGRGRSSRIARYGRSSRLRATLTRTATRARGGQAAAKRAVVEAIRTTADRLGNTPAVARGSYVHPAVVEAYLDGSIGGALVEAAEDQSAPQGGPDRAEELAVMALLRQRRPRRPRSTQA